MGLHKEMIKSGWEHCRILKAFDCRFQIEAMHTNMVNSLFVNMSTDVDLSDLDPENILDI